MQFVSLRTKQHKSYVQTSMFSGLYNFFPGIHAEVAGIKYEYWSSFAPLPVEVVLAAGQRAKEENSLCKSSFECMCLIFCLFD